MTKNADEESLCNRIEQLITEYEQSRDRDSTEIGRQFAQLQRIMLDTKDNFPSTEGAKSINRLKNRYKDVLPYDKFRVTLGTDNHSDYINASFIEDFAGDRRYIAAQGPIEDSLKDFLRMIWEFQITSVICTANEVEGGRFKFRRYWPEDEKSIQFGPYRISKDKTNDKAFSCEFYEIRPLIISQGENRRHILLYHFLHWLDHDVPNDEASILELLLKLYEDRSLSPDTPILVHCSAGCGRTGSLIAIDLCRLLIRSDRSFFTKSYPIYEIALHIRQFRIALIQTVKQYLFVHKMFVFILKANSNTLLCSPINNDENQAFNSTSTTKSSLSPSSISSSVRRPSGSFPIKLRNPPVGRHPSDGTNTHRNSSVKLLTSDFYLPPSKSSLMNVKTHTSDQPPPIPPRSSLLNTTNTHGEGQFVRSGETPIKAKRTIFRSRNVKRKEPIIMSTNARSDSVDALSCPSSRYHNRPSTNRLQVHIEQETNSD